MDYPKGIRPDGAGLRIRIFRGGRLAYSETIKGNPNSQALIKRAKARRDAVLEKLACGEPVYDATRPDANFADAAQSWLDSLQVDPDTRRWYVNILNARWMPVYQDTIVSHITEGSIKVALATFGVKVKTQKNYLGPLRLVLDHAGVRPNPAAGIKWPRKKIEAEKPQVHRFTPAERARVIDALDAIHAKAVTIQSREPRRRYKAHWAGQARVFYPLLFATGLRPGEALALRWQDYDGETVHVGATHTRNKRKAATKTGVARRVYVPSWVRPRLDQHPTRFKGQAIFVNSEGGPLTDTKRMNPMWREALRQCRLPDCDPYACRHTRASELLTTGVSIAEAAQQLGHNAAMFTGLYSRWIDEMSGRKDWRHLEGATDESPPKREYGEG